MIDAQKYDLENGSVYWFKSIFSHEECEKYRNVIDQKRPSDSRVQCFSTDKNIPQFFRTKLKPLAQHIGSNLRLYPPITVSRHNMGQSIQWHHDRFTTKYDKYKLCVYLSQSSGTEFEKTLNVPADIGDVVIFDLNLLHRGSDIQENKKYMFGFRVGVKQS